MRNRVIALLWLLGTTTAHALELIPHRAGYNANIEKGISLKGDAIRELKKLDDGRWHYRFDVKSFVADIDESVVFSWQNDQVIPARYEYELNGMMIKDRLQKVDFDWTNKQAIGKERNRDWRIAIPELALDRLGYQLQLLADVQNRKTEMHYQIVHKGKVRPSTFQVMREEKIDTVFGQVTSIVLEKVREESSKRITHLWFSKEHPFLLLKMKQIEEDGEEYEIIVKWAELNGKRL